MHTKASEPEIRVHFMAQVLIEQLVKQGQETREQLKRSMQELVKLNDRHTYEIGKTTICFAKEEAEVELVMKSYTLAIPTIVATLEAPAGKGKIYMSKDWIEVPQLPQTLVEQHKTRMAKGELTSCAIIRIDGLEAREIIEIDNKNVLERINYKISPRAWPPEMPLEYVLR